MKLQRGRNSGITGLFDIPGVEGAKFQVHILRWAPKVNGQIRQRRGRGGGIFRTVRWMFSSGNIACSGKTRLDAPPAPDAWKGQTGTITVQVGKGRTVTYPVLVVEMGFSFDKRTTDRVRISIACEIIGEPTYTGWPGTQPVATDPTRADQEQWEGTSKTIDPSAIQTASVQLIDWWGVVANTDSAESNKLASIIAAAALAPPMSGQKVRTATLTRDAIDGGQVTVNYGQTTTAEDIINPRTKVTIDPEGLESQATGAAINGTPSTPSGDSFVTFDTSTSEINDATILTEKNFALRTSKQALEMDGTFTMTDVSDIESKGRETRIYASTDSPPSPNVPSGQQKIATTLDTRNPNRKRVVYDYAKDTPKQTLEQEHTFTLTDPSGLESESQVAAQDGSPSLSGSFVSRGTRVNNVTHDHTLTTIKGGLRSTEEDITFPGTFADIDPKGIDSIGRTTEVYTTVSGAPGDPSPPSGELQIVKQLTKKENRIKSSRLTIFDVNDSEQKIGFPKFKTVVDDTNVANEAVRWKGYNVGDTPPSDPDDVPDNNVKLVTPIDLQLTPQRMMRVFLYGPQNSRDKLVLEHYETKDDVSGLESTAMRACLDGESITDPMGYVHRFTITIPVTLDLDINRTVTVKVYGLRSTQDDIEMPGTQAIVRLEDGELATAPARQTTVITCIESDTVESLADTAKAALESGSTPWKTISVEKLHDTRAIQEVQYFTDDKKFTVRAIGGRWEERMLDAGGTMVRLGEIYQVAFSHYRVTLEPWPIFVTRETVVLRRYYKAANYAADSYDQFKGTQNSDTFGDFPVGTVAFLGANVVYNFLDNDGTRWLAVDFVFERAIARNDSAAVDALWTTRGIPRGWFTITGVVIASFTPLAVALNASWVPVTLDQVTYSSVFLA